MDLTAAMLEVRAPEQTHEGEPIKLEDGSTHLWKPTLDPVGKMDSAFAQVFLRRVIEPLSLTIPDRFVAFLAKNLNHAVSIHSSNQQDGSDDHSTIWRSHLEYSSHYKTLDETVSALVQAIKVLSRQEADYTALIFHALEPYAWPIFDRLRAFTLLRANNPNKAQVAQFLNIPTRFEHASRNPRIHRATEEMGDCAAKGHTRRDSGQD